MKFNYFSLCGKNQQRRISSFKHVKNNLQPSTIHLFTIENKSLPPHPNIKPFVITNQIKIAHIRKEKSPLLSPLSLFLYRKDVREFLCNKKNIFYFDHFATTNQNLEKNTN
jgi:hypothetical protein